MVVGDRQVDVNENFSRAKRRFQRLGSWVVRQASSTEIPDTTSGFRAYNREAALQMQAVSKFTYTLETIIQAGKLLVAVDHVPIRTNAKTRESRLFPSMPAYIRRNALSIFRIYSQYEPLKVFWGGALVMGTAAFAVFIRFLVLFIESPHTAAKGHVQSLIAGAVLFNAAMLLGALGVIGDLLAAQRTLSQRTFERVRRIELQLGVEPSHYEPGAPAAPRPAPARPARCCPAAPHVRDRTARRSRYDLHPRGRAHRQHLRQVRLHQPGRAPPDGRLRAHAGRAVRASRPRVGARRRLRRGRAHRAVGASASITAGWSESTWRIPSSRRNGRSARRPNLEFRAMDGEQLEFDDGEFDLVAATEVLEHVPDPERVAGRDGPGRAPRPARVGSARAAVAGAQRRPRRVSARAGQHPRAPEPLDPALVRLAGRALRRRWCRCALRSRGRCCWSQSAPVGTVKWRSASSAGRARRPTRRRPREPARSRPAPGSCRSGSPRPASSPSPTWPPPATSSAPPPTAGSRCAGRSCS